MSQLLGAARRCDSVRRQNSTQAARKAADSQRTKLTHALTCACHPRDLSLLQVPQAADLQGSREPQERGSRGGLR
jgi:hypothetical protein